jgi:hypothetical protein
MTRANTLIRHSDWFLFYTIKSGIYGINYWFTKKIQSLALHNLFPITRANTLYKALRINLLLREPDITTRSLLRELDITNWSLLRELDITNIPYYKSISYYGSIPVTRALHYEYPILRIDPYYKSMTLQINYHYESITLRISPTTNWSPITRTLHYEYPLLQIDTLLRINPYYESSILQIDLLFRERDVTKPASQREVARTRTRPGRICPYTTRSPSGDTRN